MANNRMAIVCKKCNLGIAIAKYYPLGGFIGGSDEEGNSGWYTNRTDNEALNEFFIRHKHDYDTSTFGGEQYFLGYEGDNNKWKYED